MYTTIYKPKTINEFVGNKEAINIISQWLSNYNTIDIDKKCALISGICGIGKSLMVELLLESYNTKYLESHEERSKSFIQENIKPFTQVVKNILDKKNVLIVNDIDSNCDFGFIANLLECIKETKIPIICICNNRHDQHIKPIVNYCIDIKMFCPSFTDVSKYLCKIIQIEKIKNIDMKKLYDQSNGDIRFILNMLQFGAKNVKIGKDIVQNNLFDTTNKLFWMNETIENKYNIYCNFSDLHTLMVQENYISNVFNTHSVMNYLSNSASALSDADLFEAKIYDTQNFELEPYIGFTTINATTNCNIRSPIKFTQFIGKLAIRNKNKQSKKLDQNYQDYQDYQSIIKNEHKVENAVETNVKIKRNPIKKTKTNTEPKRRGKLRA